MAATKKNCVKGWQCGFGCIAKAKNCLKEESKEVSSKLNKLSSLLEQKTLPPHNKTLAAMADGESGPQTELPGDALVKSFNAYGGASIEDLTNKGLSEIEAYGVAAWVGQAYAPINKAIIGKEDMSEGERKYGEAAGIRAAQGLKKLDNYEPERMKEAAKTAKTKILPDGQLTRSINVAENKLEEFLKPYDEAAKSESKEYREPTFMASTALQDLFAPEANIVYDIKAKTDGNSAGKFVDEFKGMDFEGEIIFGPYSKFKVVTVDKSSNPIKIIMEEL